MLSQIAYEVLKEKIIKGELKDDQQITESEISSRFNISKTPVREALNALKSEGYVYSIPHKGYIIKSLSVKDLQQLFQTRAILEAGAIELAIKSATNAEIEEISKIAKLTPTEENRDYRHYCTEINFQFHLQIVKLSHNSTLEKMMTHVLNQLLRALYKDLHDETDVKEMYEAHIQICEALFERDAAQARLLIYQHIDKAKNRIMLGGRS